MLIYVEGNIGSGKSELINFISKLGFECISSDDIISKLYENKNTRKLILTRLNFGEKKQLLYLLLLLIKK